MYKRHVTYMQYFDHYLDAKLYDTEIQIWMHIQSVCWVFRILPLTVTKTHCPYMLQFVMADELCVEVCA